MTVLAIASQDDNETAPFRVTPGARGMLWERLRGRVAENYTDAQQGDKRTHKRVEAGHLAQEDPRQKYAPGHLLGGDYVDISGMHSPQRRIVEGVAEGQRP